VGFNSLFEPEISQNISTTDRDIILLEDFDCQCTEATHWRLRETLHIDQDWVLSDILPRKFAVT